MSAITTGGQLSSTHWLNYRCYLLCFNSQHFQLSHRACRRIGAAPATIPSTATSKRLNHPRNYQIFAHVIPKFTITMKRMLLLSTKMPFKCEMDMKFTHQVRLNGNFIPISQLAATLAIAKINKKGL